jgi:saccharopine dehydrogenase-like NADP-dependent oxidoreductase
MKRILILGASGLLARYVAKDLSAYDNNFDVAL